MAAFADRLALARQRAGLKKPSALAALVSVGEKTITNYEAGRTMPGAEVVQELSKALGVTVSWLVSGEGPMLLEGQNDGGHGAPPAPRQTTLQLEETTLGQPVALDVFEMTGGAGQYTGLALFDAPVGSYVIDLSEIEPLMGNPLRVPRKPFVLVILGDSMEDTFSSGDRVVCEPMPSGAKSIASDAIYFFRLEDGLHVKQLEKKPGRRLVARPRNRNYEPFELAPSDDFEIYGRVWGKWKRY
jgi:phage repressor protein C with HTH and peptisase S24 domain